MSRGQELKNAIVRARQFHSLFWDTARNDPIRAAETDILQSYRLNKQHWRNQATRLLEDHLTKLRHGPVSPRDLAQWELTQLKRSTLLSGIPEWKKPFIHVQGFFFPL